MRSPTPRDPLAGTRPAFMPDPDDPVDPVRREVDLCAVLAQTREVAARPSPAPLRRRLQALTAAAAVVLVAAAVVATTPASEPPRASRLESPREVLLAAAAAAAAPSPTASRYWHVRALSRRVELVPAGPGHGPFHVILGLGDESWTSRTGTEPGVSLPARMTTRPLTDRDRVEWEKAGKPQGGPHTPTHPTTGEPIIGFSVGPPRTGEQMFFLAEKEIPLSEVLALPTDTAGMRAYLQDRFRRFALQRVDPSTESHWMAYEAGRLLSGEMPTTRETRVATYEMLASLPGLRAMDRTELPDRRAVGVAVKDHTGPYHDVVINGVVELQLIIDPDTGLLTESRDVVVDSGTGATPVSVGTVVYSNRVLHAGWGDTDPALPPGVNPEQPPKQARR